MANAKHRVYKVEDKEGVVHIRTTAGEFDPFETFCGELENLENKMTRTSRALPCGVCKHTFKVLKNGIILERS